jgi:hypothetical protein
VRRIRKALITAAVIASTAGLGVSGIAAAGSAVTASPTQHTYYHV